MNLKLEVTWPTQYNYTFSGFFCKCVCVKSLVIDDSFSSILKDSNICRIPLQKILYISFGFVEVDP